MKEPKKNKSSYMIIAAALLAIGGVARILVGNSAKVEEPKKTTSEITSSIEIQEEPEYKTDNIYDETLGESDTEDVAQLPSESGESVDSNDSVSSVPPSESEETKPAAADVIKYVMPIKGNILKSYSNDSLVYSKTYDDMRTHNGIDILAETGSVVKPVSAGTIKDVYEDLLLGKTVVIDHGDEIYSYYSGLNDASVKKGDTVSVSKVIGTVGEVPSECLDAPHLHFMIKKGDEYQPPLKFMGLE